MNLRELVNELKSSRKIIRSPQLPVKLAVEKSYERVAEKYDQIGSISVLDYRDLLERLKIAADAKSLTDLSYRDMRLAASCLFESRPRLADNLLFLDLYLDALRSLRSRLAIKRLIHSYCLHFDPTDHAIRRIGEFLQTATREINGQWNWPDRHRKYRLFDPTQAPQELAIITTKASSPRNELEKAGLTGQLMVSGLSAYTYLHALEITQRNLERHQNIEDVNRVIAWARAEDGTLLYSAYRSKLANALLLPFVDRDPTDEVHRRVQTFLLEVLNDPRIEKAQWLGAEEAAVDVIVRWLAQATLEQFLKVVDRVAAKEQWDYRRSFWGAYIAKRAVMNSWVAFGSEGAQFAKQLSKDTADKMLLRFATLEGAGADQAVLLLSIGDLVVADWSHNGRLRIWRRGNKSVPKFNNPHYIAKTLRTNSDFDTVHLPPDGWQARAEAYIRKHTNVKLTEKEYMPRRRA
jgi:hypothetical protein